MANSITNQLEELFDEWKKEQKDEVNNKNEKCEENNYLKRYEKGKLKNLDIRNSFTRDGIVNEEAWFKGERILFILKEANVEEQLKAANSDNSVKADEIFGECFWFKDRITNNKYNWKNKIFRRLRKVGESWTGNKDFSLESVAYMNINKRGGLSQAKEDVIDGYFEKYQSRILEEIKIINPFKIAICCGDQGYVGKLDELIKKWDKSIVIKRYNHPSKRWGTDEQYLKGI